ncbi:MAG: DUF2281 domain-containing protein [Candidatus Caldatribacteriota bacterium]|nr:DUF2281 domain-containing protein [Candidatus Caldatribacteriota bacterium]
MKTTKENLRVLIDKISENEAKEVLDFVGYLNMKRRREKFKDLELASEISLGFWNNDIDNRIWNNV